MYSHSYTLANVGGLISTTYIMAVVWAIVCLLICWLIAKLIAFEGGKNPRDAFKRRVWFYVILAFSGISFFLFNFLHVLTLVKGVPAQDKFTVHIAVTTLLVLVIYVLLVLIVSKIFPSTKIGTIFPSKK